MSNCVVGSCGFDLPSGVVAEHGVKGSDHLSHHGDDDNLGLFVCAGETVVECFEGRVVSAGAERRHVEDVSDGHPAAVDAAMSPKFAAIEVVGRKPDKRSNLLAAHLPEFWQQGDQRECQYGPNARHRDQQLVSLSESKLGRDELRHALVEQADIRLQPRQTAFVEPPQHGVLDMGGLVFAHEPTPVTLQYAAFETYKAACS